MPTAITGDTQENLLSEEDEDQLKEEPLFEEDFIPIDDLYAVQKVPDLKNYRELETLRERYNSMNPF